MIIGILQVHRTSMSLLLLPPVGVSVCALYPASRAHVSVPVTSMFFGAMHQKLFSEQTMNWLTGESVRTS